MPEVAGIAYRVSRGGGAQPSPPPLVLIHGAGGSSLHWPPHLRRLPHIDVYAVDLPGHGESAGASADNITEKATDLIHWMDALELGPSIVAGHSMGGAIALTLALDFNRYTAGLILVGSGGRLRVNPAILENSASEESYHQSIETILDWSYSDSVDPGLVALAGERMSSVPAHVMHADYRACDRFDVLPRLGEIDLPTLVICGTDDRMTPPKYSQYLVDQIPGASLAMIDSAGHMVMLEQPEAVSAAISDFILALR